MPDDFEDFCNGMSADEIIDRRCAQGAELAEKHPELKSCKTFTEFLGRLSDMGIDLDFIRASSMWESLKE